MLIFAAALALGQGTLFNTVVAHSDPANGYEDYVRAAAMLEQGRVGDYLEWEGFVYRGSRDDPSLRCPNGLNESDSDLDVRAHIAQRFGDALSAMAAGNRKGIYDPRTSYTPDTTFPELYYFKRLAMCTTISASVDFAHGRSDVATNDLIEGFRFSNRIGTSTLVQHLVGIACHSILEAELSRHLPQLSLEDAQKLHAYADEMLGLRNLGALTVRRDAQIAIAAVDQALSNPLSAGAVSTLAEDPANPGGTALLNDIRKLSPAEREALKPQVIERINEFVGQVAQVMQGPEGDWLSGTKWPETGDGTLADRIASMLLPSYTQVVQAEARDQVKARLLRLNAMAIEFRWIHTKLPDKLEDFTDPEDRKDPFTGTTFSYRKVGDWYSLTSQGFGGFKTFDLKPTPGNLNSDETIKP